MLASYASNIALDRKRRPIMGAIRWWLYSFMITPAVICLGVISTLNGWKISAKQFDTNGSYTIGKDRYWQVLGTCYHLNPPTR